MRHYPTLDFCDKGPCFLKRGHVGACNDTVRAVPAPPIPPPGVMPAGPSKAWADWHLLYTFSPDDAVIIEYCALQTGGRSARVLAYAGACHERRWAGWQATLAMDVIDALWDASLPAKTGGDYYDDDIPF